MPRSSRGWLPTLLNPQQRYKELIGIGTVPAEWSLDAIEQLVPPQVMAMFPDLGSWLLRRRDNYAASPVVAVERLNTLPRPIQDGDKDTLVGAVLTMSASLNMALDMLVELLPQDKSRERLGEVLCPTLGHLLASLQHTLSNFDQTISHPPSTAPLSPPSAKSVTKYPTPDRGVEPPHTPRPTDPEHQQPSSHLSREDASSQLVEGPGPNLEQFPNLHGGSGLAPSQQPHAEASGQQGSGLIEALQAEMRVQAAIHVAVESLEFAEGQLRLVRQLNGLHGGSKSQSPLNPYITNPWIDNSFCSALQASRLSRNTFMKAIIACYSGLLI